MDTMKSFLPSCTPMIVMNEVDNMERKIGQIEKYLKECHAIGR